VLDIAVSQRSLLTGNPATVSATPVARVRFTLGFGSIASTKGAAGSVVAKLEATAYRKIELMVCRTRLATSNAPRLSTLRTIAKMSAGLISATSFVPIAGSTSPSRRDQTRSA
jgi:hypothetical protein